MKRLTVEFIMSCEPCDTYPEKRVKELIGPNGKTLLQILALDISAEDRIWCMTRPDVLTHQEQVQFAIYCARRSLPNFERKYPGDKRPRKAVDAAEAWLHDPTDANRKRAAWSAASAARSAAWSAAWSAASAASAARSDASAARSDARQNQIEELITIIKARKK